MSSELAGARGRLETAEGSVDLFRLDALDADLVRLPKTVLILLENLLRRAGSRDVSDDDVRALAAWPGPADDVAFMPGRVLMQDFTGVPAVVDLAAMRSAALRAGADPMATECVGGAVGITEQDLERNYATLCDPRLNYRQALEMSFRIARRMSRLPRAPRP